VGSYDPETLGFSSQIDAHCLHIKQDAHRLLYPTEGCISIQQVGRKIVVKQKLILHKLPHGLHKYFSTKHGDSHNYYGTIVAHRANSKNYTVKFDCCRGNELVKIRTEDFKTLLPEQEHEPEVDEKAMEEQLEEWLQNDENEKDSAEFMSEREFCSLERDQIKTAKYFQHKFSNKDDPINWTILAEDEDIADCSAFKSIVQQYEEEGAALDKDFLKAMDSKRAHEVFFEIIFPELKSVAARIDKYYEDPRAEYYTTVRDRHIKFNDPTAEDPDWKIKNNILLLLAAANKSATGVDGLWKSGHSDICQEPRA
jgi:hypothetical protein